MTNDDNNASCFFGSPQSWNFDIQVDQLNWSQILGCAQMSIASNPPTSWLRNVVCVYIYYLYYIYIRIYTRCIYSLYTTMYINIYVHTLIYCVCFWFVPSRFVHKKGVTDAAGRCLRMPWTQHHLCQRHTTLRTVSGRW
jgi:hypothetical protein